MSILKPRDNFQPYQYPWAYKAWEMQQRIHWLHTETQMGQDRMDWQQLDESTRWFYTHILSYFTQSDINVLSVYSKQYKTLFPHPEVQMMLAAFENTETIHVAAYKFLLDSLGLNFEEYINQGFFAAKDRFFLDYTIKSEDPYDIAVGIGAYGAFTEGYQLFSNFVALMSPAHKAGKFRNVSQIVGWSLRDEALHTDSLIKLYRTLVRENKLEGDKLIPRLTACAERAYKNEMAFIDELFLHGTPIGLEKPELQEFMTGIHAIRCKQLGIKPLHEPRIAPDLVLPWFFQALTLPMKGNFFETVNTDYSKSGSAA